jgi:hypothetical protein
MLRYLVVRDGLMKISLSEFKQKIDKDVHGKGRKANSLPYLKKAQLRLRMDENLNC